MIIELLGVPACGKSTLSRKICKQVKTTNPLEKNLYSSSRSRQNLNKIRLMIYLFSKRPFFSVKVMRVINRYSFATLWDKLKMILYLFSVIGAIELSLNRGEENIVLDEGVGQVIWGIQYYSTTDSKIILQLTDSLKKYIGDEIYLISTPSNVVFERLKKRFGAGGASLIRDVKNDRRKLDEAYGYIDNVIRKYHEMGYKDRIKVVEYDENSVHN